MYIGSKNVAYSRARMRFSFEISEPNLLDDNGDCFSLSSEFSVEKCGAEHVLQIEKEGIEVNAVAGDNSVTA